MSEQNVGNDTSRLVGGNVALALPLSSTAQRDRILSGYLLPTTEQLLLGMPFLANDISRDMKMFAETLLREMESMDASGTHVRIKSAFQAILMDESLESVQAAADALRDTNLHRGGWSSDARSSKLRCWLYSVHLGDTHSIIPIAITTATLAYQRDQASSDDSGDLLWRALGWLTLYAADIPELFHDAPPFTDVVSVADRIAQIAEVYRDLAATSISRATP